MPGRRVYATGPIKIINKARAVPSRLRRGIREIVRDSLSRKLEERIDKSKVPRLDFLEIEEKNDRSNRDCETSGFAGFREVKNLMNLIPSNPESV